MAQTKVTQEALVQLMRVLSQSAESILTEKESMDSILNGIVWDDQTGWYFRNKYEEDFKPLTEKLIPNIEMYLEHLTSLGIFIEEFAVDSNELVNTSQWPSPQFGPRDMSKRTKPKMFMRQSPSIAPFLTVEENGKIIWDNDRFKQLEKETSSYLESNEGKNLIKNINNEFHNVKPDLNSMTKDELNQIITGSITSNDPLPKNDNGENRAQHASKIPIAFGKGSKARPKPNQAILGWHTRGSNDAILNQEEEKNLSMCQKIAVYAHEARHAVQTDIISKSKLKDEKQLSLYEKLLRKADEDYVSATENFQDYQNNYLEVEARRYEFAFGKVCTDYHNETLKKKTNE